MNQAGVQFTTDNSRFLADNGTAVDVLSHVNEDFLSLTDMLKARDGEFFISDLLRNRNTVEFPGNWEQLNNPGFNSVEFDGIKEVSDKVLTR